MDSDLFRKWLIGLFKWSALRKHEAGRRLAGRGEEKMHSCAARPEDDCVESTRKHAEFVKINSFIYMRKTCRVHLIAFLRNSSFYWKRMWNERERSVYTSCSVRSKRRLQRQAARSLPCLSSTTCNFTHRYEPKFHSWTTTIENSRWLRILLEWER